jgi:hypothetical protein
MLSERPLSRNHLKTHLDATSPYTPVDSKITSDPPFDRAQADRGPGLEASPLHRKSGNQDPMSTTVDKPPMSSTGRRCNTWRWAPVLSWLFAKLYRWTGLRCCLCRRPADIAIAGEGLCATCFERIDPWNFAMSLDDLS